MYSLYMGGSIKSRMQEKPSTTLLSLFFIFLFFINQFSLFLSAIL